MLIALHTIWCKHWLVYLASLPPLSIKPLAVAIDSADTLKNKGYKINVERESSGLPVAGSQDVTQR